MELQVPSVCRLVTKSSRSAVRNLHLRVQHPDSAHLGFLPFWAADARVFQLLFGFF